MEKYQINKVETDRHGVTITLLNGVVVRLAANDGFVNVNFSGIGNQPIGVRDQGDNQLNISYDKDNPFNRGKPKDRQPDGIRLEIKGVPKTNWTDS